MAKQKIVIEVPLNCEKCKTEVMKIVFKGGVTKVEFEQQERDKVVIIGEGVDAASVTKRLRKKLGYALLESVSKVDEKS